MPRRIAQTLQTEIFELIFVFSEQEILITRICSALKQY